MSIYTSGGRRRRRRLILILVVAVVGGVAAFVMLRGGAPQATPPSTTQLPPPSPPPPARLSVLDDLNVHRCETATVAYRVIAADGSRWQIDLVIRDATGARVKTRRIESSVLAGERARAAVRIDLPPGRYRYSLALRPASTGIAASSASPPASPDADGPTPTPSADAQGSAATLRVLPPLPPGFPSARAAAAALAWAKGRSGNVAVAVVDSNGEDVRGLRVHRTFQAASLAKAILLVASLRADPTPDAATKATLMQMIEESDNGCAYTVFNTVGAKGMRAVARASGMRDYEQGDGWVDTRVSAADEARFFYHLEGLVPAAGRRLARRLLSGITPIQRWGIPAAAGIEGWDVYFKGGWLGMDNKLMVQAAWLKKGKRRWALAVMSDDNPTRSYGWDTQKGVTGLLLGQQPTAAYLARVLE